MSFFLNATVIEKAMDEIREELDAIAADRRFVLEPRFVAFPERKLRERRRRSAVNGIHRRRRKRGRM